VIIGLISDTHGVLRDEAKRALAGVTRILHAGDIGTPEVLTELAAIAPVHAVRGNNDTGTWARRIPVTEAVQLEGVEAYVLHDLHELDLDPIAAGFAVVVSGHSHRPEVSERDGVLYVNPGSAGPRRFKLPVTVAFLEVTRGTARAWIHPIL
jgi:putative phosphoesterase